MQQDHFNDIFGKYRPKTLSFNIVFVAICDSCTVPELYICARVPTVQWEQRRGANGQTYCGGHSGLAHQSAIISFSLSSVVPSPLACLAFICSCFRKQPRWQPNLSLDHHSRSLWKKTFSPKRQKCYRQKNDILSNEFLLAVALTCLPAEGNFLSFYFFHLYTIIYSSPCAISLP